MTRQRAESFSLQPDRPSRLCSRWFASPLAFFVAITSASDLLSGFIPSIPSFSNGAAVNPLDDFNLITKSMKHLTRFADRIASKISDPSPESADRKNNNNSNCRLGLLSQQGNLFELKLRPQIDWQETRDGFVLSAATPGLRREDLFIEVIEESGVNYLEISSNKAEKAAAQGYNSEDLSLRTSYQGFNHKVKLPVSIDLTSLNAKYENGLLIVTIHKTEKPISQRRKIAIS